MKIIQLLPELNEGGVERGTIELSRELTRRGHTSIVFSNGGKLVQQLENQGGTHLNIDLYHKNPFTVPSRVHKLRLLLAEIQPDIIHARSRVPAWLALLANRNPKRPFVTTMHGIYSVSPYSRIMTKGDAVICVSEVIRNHAIQNYATDPQKITVIQRGVDLEYFHPKKIDQQFITSFKATNNLNDKYVVTSVGRITYLKNYETFIRAIALAMKKIPAICGLIVGGTSHGKEGYLASLKDLAASLGISRRITFAGSQSKMPEMYALSDITVNASLTMGNVGRTVVESLAMDIPVLATSYKGLNNLVDNGVNGFIIATNDPQDLTRKIIQAHKTKFKNIREGLNPEYTLQTMVEKTVTVYHHLLAAKEKR